MQEFNIAPQSVVTPKSSDFELLLRPLKTINAASPRPR